LVLVMVLGLGTALAQSNPLNIGDAQFLCAYEAAITTLESSGTLTALYQQYFSGTPPSGFVSCSRTWASCDATYGATPKSCGTLERVFAQGYILTGTFIAAPAIYTVTDIAGTAGGNATGYLAPLADAIVAQISIHYKGASATPPTVLWKLYPFASPWNNNVQYWLNQRTVDWSLGFVSNAGTWLVEPPGTPVNRTSLVQYPQCPYIADSDGILQGFRALPSGVVGPLNITSLDQSSASGVVVCVQTGSNFDIGFNTRAGFMATKTQRASLKECTDAVAEGTVHAVYSLKSALQVAYDGNSTFYYSSPVAIIPAGATVSQLYPLFRIDGAGGCLNAAAHTRPATQWLAMLAVALALITAMP